MLLINYVKYPVLLVNLFKGGQPPPQRRVPRVHRITSYNIEHPPSILTFGLYRRRGLAVYFYTLDL